MIRSKDINDHHRCIQDLKWKNMNAHLFDSSQLWCQSSCSKRYTTNLEFLILDWKSSTVHSYCKIILLKKEIKEIIQYFLGKKSFDYCFSWFGYSSSWHSIFISISCCKFIFYRCCLVYFKTTKALLSNTFVIF